MLVTLTQSCTFQIPSLVEVYVGNNNIQSSHDVFMLKVCIGAAINEQAYLINSVWSSTCDS